MPGTGENLTQCWSPSISEAPGSLGRDVCVHAGTNQSLPPQNIPTLEENFWILVPKAYRQLILEAFYFILFYFHHFI